MNKNFKNLQLQPTQYIIIKKSLKIVIPTGGHRVRWSIRVDALAVRKFKKV